MEEKPVETSFSQPEGSGQGSQANLQLDQEHFRFYSLNRSERSEVRPQSCVLLP